MEHEWVRIQWGFAYRDMDGWLTAHCINKKIITQHGLWLKTASSLELWYISTMGQNPWWYHSSGIFLASHSEHVLSKDTFWVGSTGQSTAASLAVSASDPHRGNISCNIQDHSRPLWMVSWQIRSCLAAPARRYVRKESPVCVYSLWQMGSCLLLTDSLWLMHQPLWSSPESPSSS